MANIEQKMNEVMRGVQVAEDYLDYLRARINKAQDRASFCHVESQKMNGEASDLEVELKPLRAECAQLTAELLTQEMQLESVNEEIHKAEDLLKTAESLVDDTCFKDIVDNVMKATLIFREKVRIANPAILAHELSLRKTLQSFTLEETTLRCEIRVLEEKQCTVRSGNTDNNMLQVFNMQQKKRELHHLLDTEKQIRQELIDSCNKMIVQKKSEVSVAKEEYECLQAARDSAILELQKANKELQMEREKRLVMQRQHSRAQKILVPTVSRWEHTRPLTIPGSSHVSEWPKSKPRSANNHDKATTDQIDKSCMDYNAQRKSIHLANPSNPNGSFVSLAPSTPKTFTRNPPPQTPVLDMNSPSVSAHCQDGYSDSNNFVTSEYNTIQVASNDPNNRSSPHNLKSGATYIDRNSSLKGTKRNQCASSSGCSQEQHQSQRKKTEDQKSSRPSHHFVYKRTVVVQDIGTEKADVS